MDNDIRNLADSDPDIVTVHAGFPNPAADRRGTPALNLDQLLIAHPTSTYLFRVRGDDGVEQGIFDGDIAVIDRALTPRSSDLVLAWFDHEFAIKSFQKVTPDVAVWGVISSVIHQYR
jgi:SOS-response transcriptional repressor LexA